MRVRTIIALSALSALLSASSFAAADSRASLTFSMPVLSYSSIEQTIKPDGGAETKETTTQLITADLGDSYIAASLDKVNIYLYPFSSLRVVSASYMLRDDVELGLNLGLNSSKAKEAKTEASENSFGAFAYYYPQFGAVSGEFGLNVDSVNSESEKPDATDPSKKEKSTESNLAIRAVAYVVVPLAKNVNYLGGLSYTTSNGEAKSPKTKTGESGLGVNLATLRFTLD